MEERAQVGGEYKNGVRLQVDLVRVSCNVYLMGAGATNDLLLVQAGTGSLTMGC